MTISRKLMRKQGGLTKGKTYSETGIGRYDKGTEMGTRGRSRNEGWRAVGSKQAGGGISRRGGCGPKS